MYKRGKQIIRATGFIISLLFLAFLTAFLPAFYGGLAHAAENRTVGLIAYSGRPGFSVYLMDDGRVYTMGDNAFAQLGNGKASVTPQYYAKRVEYIDGITAVSAGNYHVLALDEKGHLYAWGNNTYGQLGIKDADTVARYLNKNEFVSERDLSYATTIFIQGADKITAVSAGGSFSAVLDDKGQVWAFGSNSNGQLGTGADIGNNSFSPLPSRVKGVSGEGYLSGIIQIAALENAAVALDSSGNVYAWGSNYYGVLGDGRAAANSAVPVLVQSETGALPSIKSIAAYDKNVIALSNSGEVFVWGNNMFGQKGDGTYHLTERIAKAHKVEYFSEQGITPRQVICGSNIYFVITGQNDVYGWGMCIEGGLGMGTYDNFPDYVKVTDGDGNIVSRNEVVLPCKIDIADGGENFKAEEFIGCDYRSFIRSGDGSVWSFGNNNFGQSGYSGTEEGVTRPSVASIEFNPKYEDGDFSEKNYLLKPAIVTGVTAAAFAVIFVRAAILKRVSLKRECVRS